MSPYLLALQFLKLQLVNFTSQKETAVFAQYKACTEVHM
jgi:hypothetical protein